MTSISIRKMQSTSFQGAASGYPALDGAAKYAGLGSTDTGEKQANKNIANGYAGLNASGVLGGAIVPQFYGDGACGTVTISACSSISRDAQYAALTINANKTLNTQGNIIRVNGTLTVSAGGVITDNTTGACGATGASGGGAGSPGNVGTAAPSTVNTKNQFLTGKGGSGGAGGAGSPITSGTGGSGGNGGKGGGITIVYAKIINNAGKIHANGGCGQNGSPGANSAFGSSGGGGAGSGGDGGTLKVVYSTTAGCGAGTLTANAGLGGMGGVGGVKTSICGGTSRVGLIGALGHDNECGVGHGTPAGAAGAAAGGNGGCGGNATANRASGASGGSGGEIAGAGQSGAGGKGGNAGNGNAGTSIIDVV